MALTGLYKVWYPGSTNVSNTVTGLTSGTNYEFRLMLRNDSGTTQRNYSGSSSLTRN